VLVSSVCCDDSPMSSFWILRCFDFTCIWNCCGCVGYFCEVGFFHAESHRIFVYYISSHVHSYHFKPPFISSFTCKLSHTSDTIKYLPNTSLVNQLQSFQIPPSNILPLSVFLHITSHKIHTSSIYPSPPSPSPPISSANPQAPSSSPLPCSKTT